MKWKCCLIVVIVLFLTACMPQGLYPLVAQDDDGAIADQKFEQMLDALRNQDGSALTALFSQKAQEQAEDLPQQAEKLLAYLGEDIIAYSDAIDAGISSYMKKDDGKRSKTINASFRLETDSGTFYVAMLIYEYDTFDSSNTGVASICVINAEKWKESASFRGDGNGNLGINIME